MALKPGDVKNFQTLKRAFAEGNVALMECTDRETGEYRAVICMANRASEDTTDFVPVCHMPLGNPYDIYVSSIEREETVK